MKVVLKYCDIPLWAVDMRGDYGINLTKHNDLFITVNRQLTVVRVDFNEDNQK